MLVGSLAKANLEKVFECSSAQDAPTDRALIIKQILQRINRVGIRGKREKGDKVAGIGREYDNHE